MKHQRTPLVRQESSAQTIPRANGTVAQIRQGRGPRAISRRYEITYLSEQGHVVDASRVAPATPQFEEAFSAFAHGTLFQTDKGLLSVEDIYPGLEVETEAGYQTVLWVGSMTVMPWSETGPQDPCQLMRVTSASWGIDRPTQDLLLGSGARILYRHAGCQNLLGSDSGFAPARSFIDGDSMTTVRPVSSVRLFHLGFFGQQTLRANGLPVESYHPGLQADMMMDHESRIRFLSLFPHVETLADFGPMPQARLTRFEVDNLRLG